MRIQTKTWILDDTNRLNVEEINFLESGHLVVDVLLSSICGTDLHIMAGHDSLSRPLSLGHEFIGSVVSAPNNQYETGDRIIIAPGVPCGECYYCSNFGNGNWCINRKSHGIYGLDSSFPVLGGFSSRIALAHGIKTYKIPDSMADQVAVLAEPLTVAIRALDRGFNNLRSNKDRRIAVVGLGPIGALTCILAKAYGYDVIGVDKEQYRVEYMNKKIGINSFAKQDCMMESIYDVVIECTGEPESIPTCIHMLRRGGRLVVAGHFYPNGKVEIDPYNICRNDIEVCGTILGDESSYRTAINLLTRKDLPWDNVISDIYSFDRVPEAFEKALDRHCMKVAVRIN